MNDRKYQYRQTSLLIAHSSKSKHDFASGPIISPPEHTHEYPPGVLMHFPPLHGSSKFEHSSISTHRWPSNKSSYPTAQAHENDPKMYLYIKLIETLSWCMYHFLLFLYYHLCFNQHDTWCVNADVIASSILTVFTFIFIDAIRSRSCLKIWDHLVTFSLFLCDCNLSGM